jgi:two-component system sensor histidine kinase ChvG
MATGEPDRKQGRAISPITWRILAVNVLALVILVAGMLYLANYRRGLIAAELAALHTQADLFAVALGEGAWAAEPAMEEVLSPSIAQQLTRRLAEASGTRARLFDEKGAIQADSRLLVGPRGTVEIEELPPPMHGQKHLGSFLRVFDSVADQFSGEEALPIYREVSSQAAGDYDEVLEALRGKAQEFVRAIPGGGIMLGVAAPIQRYKHVLGALLVSKPSHDIDAAVLKVRVDILKVFAVTLVLTVLVSIYLSGTIARPLRRLAIAAERVRKDRSRVHSIPDFGHRRDEIGQLSVALREMTEALRWRMDEIERFAADVSHEIKNPLTSLKSAVETAARARDPEKQRKLMAIIEDDVDRLDRLISDISDASRLDAELSRAEATLVDVGRMLATLADVSNSSAASNGVRLGLNLANGAPLVVHGVEGRLVQVFRNLIANAMSFSPPGGEILLKASRCDGTVVAEVLDEGPGIPEGKEKDIFERFYSERPEGEKFGIHSGLGLSISLQIVEAHQGRVFVENRRRKDGGVGGARFVVQLPAA